ncbi:phosphopantetheine-binding protein [Micromonospora sp. BRA006-A]|nr:phosphopantetheine-binding protein [Micromonospora sp. BRA006-A]
MWCAALGVDRIGVTDRFFDLGGDSILALRVVGLAERRGLTVALRDGVRPPGARRAGPAVDAAAGGDSATAGPVEPFAMVAPADRDRLPAGLTDAYPLTRMQQGMLYELLADAGKGAYHNVTSFRGAGAGRVRRRRHAGRGGRGGRPVRDPAHRLRLELLRGAAATGARAGRVAGRGGRPARPDRGGAGPAVRGTCTPSRCAGSNWPSRR